MIGWRGPIAIACAALVIAAVNAPAIFGADPPPMALRALVSLLMAGPLSIGLYVSHFTARRNSLLAHGLPRACEIEVKTKRDPDGASYEARICIDGETWRAPLASRQSVVALATKGPVRGECWIDPASGAPLALRHEGRMLETIPVISRL